jgi:uncharacterized damage-inducible protein DinB
VFMIPDAAQQIARFLVSNIEAEIAITTNVFAAVPPDRTDYRPHPMSKSAMELLRHLTLEDEWFLSAIVDGSFGPFPDESDACGIMTPADAVADYQRRIPPALKRVAAMSGDALAREMDMLGFIKMPAIGFLSLMMRHTVHHRGQLSAYLRSMGAKVPGIYGPSADTVAATT